MANFIQQTDINPSQFVTPTSRYNNSPVIYYTDLMRITFTTYKRQPLTTSPLDKFMIISKGFEFRPDLVSQRAYGFPDYWWKIMETNGLFDVYDFKAGVNIRIPDINSIGVGT